MNTHNTISYGEWSTSNTPGWQVVYRACAGNPISIEGPTAGDAEWARRTAAALLAAAEYASDEQRRKHREDTKSRTASAGADDNLREELPSAWYKIF